MFSIEAVSLGMLKKILIGHDSTEPGTCNKVLRTGNKHVKKGSVGYSGQIGNIQWE